MEKTNKELEELERKYKQEEIEIDLTPVDRFVKFIKVIGIGLIVPIILIIILVFLIAFMLIHAYWYIDKTAIIEYLEMIYSDKYKIVSQTLNEEGEGYYKICIKGNEEIVFNGYHKGYNTNREDSQAHKLKYYYENLENQELKQSFVPNQSTYKIREQDDVEFLKYELSIYVSNYNEFEEKVLKCYEMLQYCKEKEIYGYVIHFIYNDYHSGFGQDDSKLDYETLLSREKDKYMERN